jgi:predicted phosphate transport protein (TIGR00153 family)
LGVDAITRWFLPREGRFQEILTANTANLVRGAHLFRDIARCDSLERRRILAVELKGVEHDGDAITRKLFDALNSTFITPFDREDLRALATFLDDILDGLEGVAQHLVLFELRDAPEGLRQFADILATLVEEVGEITRLVWDLRQAKEIRAALVRISDLENRGDALYGTVIADLFRGAGAGLGPIEILKWKEVYEGLENSCDGCKDYGHVIANIVTKNT